MFIKSASLAILALAASVAAQGGVPNHTYFTNPITDERVLTAGTNITFGWMKPCTAPSDSVSPTPTNAEVQLIDSTASGNAFFVAHITNIDCTKQQGNNYWVVPTNLDPNNYYSLQIIMNPQNAYSGRFKVTGGSGGSGSPPPSGGSTAPPADTKPSAAGSLVPALAGAFAVVSAAAAMLV
ncbi:hypothetical protein BGX27_006753 [Mortierella sp. AM989]|nr:hypothetical protein BGX27_006753 [Mortierella sp. AM989]